MYLNVTGLTTYNVDHDSFCIRWTPHRAATSYRLKVNPVDRKCSAHVAPHAAALLSVETTDSSVVSAPVASKNGAQEITVRGSESSYCFTGLSPDTLYKATVFTQTPNMEGPGVSVEEKTCKITLTYKRAKPSVDIRGHSVTSPPVDCEFLCFVRQWSNPRRRQPSLPPLPHLQQSLLRWMVSIPVIFVTLYGSNLDRLRPSGCRFILYHCVWVEATT